MNIKTWKLALAFGLPLVIAMSVFNFFTHSDHQFMRIAIIFFTFMMVSFGFAALFKKMSTNLYKSVSVEIDKNEKVVHKGPANHFKNNLGVGGKLVLTDRRLIFKAHKYNHKVYQQNIELNNIPWSVTGPNLGDCSIMVLSLR